VVDSPKQRTARTSGVIEPRAEEIIQKLNSYAEVISPSGTGNHIWVNGALLKSGRRKGRTTRASGILERAGLHS